MTGHLGPRDKTSQLRRRLQRHIHTTSHSYLFCLAGIARPLRALINDIPRDLAHVVSRPLRYQPRPPANHASPSASAPAHPTFPWPCPLSASCQTPSQPYPVLPASMRLSHSWRRSKCVCSGPKQNHAKRHESIPVQVQCRPCSNGRGRRLEQASTCARDSTHMSSSKEPKTATDSCTSQRLPAKRCGHRAGTRAVDHV